MSRSLLLAALRVGQSLAQRLACGSGGFSRCPKQHAYSHKLRSTLGGALSLLFLILPALPLYADDFTVQSGRGPAHDVALHHSSRAALYEPDPNGIEFTLVQDGVDAGGSWFQTFRMLIKPGGTLADASELIYGNSEHIADLFAAIKKQRPDLRGPSQLPANIEAELTLDPRHAFVPRSVSADPTRGATVYTYYNGAKRIVYDPKQAKDHKGLSSIVELPADRPTKTFTILEDYVPREVPAGVRIAYYEFQSGDDLKKVVAEIYGTDSTRAIHHFLTQAQWDPNIWPPPPNDRQQRLILPSNASFGDEPFTPLDLVTGNPAAGDQLREQTAKRAHSGIYALFRQPYGTVYRIVANDFNLTARQVSTLLYGQDGEYLSIAAQAGFATLHDLMQNPPRDLRLFGRTFDLVVDYEKEQFLSRPATVDERSGKRTILLLNGTIVEEWPLGPKQSGVLRQIALPSGYRKMLYRPHTVSALAAQILYSLTTLGRGSDSPQVRQEDEGGFVSRLIWHWGRSLPRQNGDLLDFGRLLVVPTGEDDKTDQLLEVAIRPASHDGLYSLPFYRTWLDGPFVLGAGVVIVALFTLGVFGWVARRV